MGQIADDVIAGVCCSSCMMFFKDPRKPGEVYEHGYPVICKKCWAGMSKTERNTSIANGLQIAIVDVI